MTSRILVAPSALLALALMAGCSANGTDDAAEPRERPARGAVIDAHGYEVPSDPESAANFPLNRTVIEGTVASIGLPMRAVATGEAGEDIDVVYTPVQVRVDSSYLGQFEAGDMVTVRFMGGSADGLTFNLDTAPDLSRLSEGLDVMLFATKPSQLGGEDGVAVTPNFLYLKVGGQFVDATFPGGTDDAAQVAVDVLRNLVAALG